MANTENLSYMSVEDDQALLDKLWEFSFLLARERAEGLVQHSDTYPKRIALGLHTGASVKSDFFAGASEHRQLTLRSESVASTAVDTYAFLAADNPLVEAASSQNLFPTCWSWKQANAQALQFRGFFILCITAGQISRGVEETHSHLRDETRRKRNGVISKEASFFKSCNSGILNQRAVDNINISMSEVATAPRSLWGQPMRRTWLPTCTPWPEDMPKTTRPGRKWSSPAARSCMHATSAWKWLLAYWTEGHAGKISPKAAWRSKLLHPCPSPGTRPVWSSPTW